ncbi:hypothetical protein DL771_001778 [Monosporascus sp. 5C6A]|nr:hypothetical protein DL771_001778 [Monosporascus sp. 5C6A]
MVFYSLQALSAVCMCCDMIDEKPPPSLDAVNQILMTGYRLYNLASEQMRDLIAQPDTRTSEMELLLASAVLSSAPPPSRTHVMFPILAATSQAALSKLQERLKSLFHSEVGHEQNQLSACAAAFEFLVNIRTETFSHSDSSAPRSTGLTAKEPRIGSWLRCYASRHVIPRPTEPLTRPFLAFLVQAPQAYLDLVLPLLDQRLESPPASSDTSAQLTKEQALALDIYAHWSVFMFLVQEESWWIGKLPIVTLTGMVNRYGDNFFTPASPHEDKDSADNCQKGGKDTNADSDRSSNGDPCALFRAAAAAIAATATIAAGFRRRSR